MKTHAASRKFALCSSLSTLACFAALASAAPAQAETLVTGPSPFANCTLDDVAGQDGTNYPNAEVEPWLSANPSWPKNLVAGWQQDRWSNGGSRGLVAGYTYDGGRTWNASVPQGTTKCAGGPFTRASDPWTTISPNGVAYFMSLGFQNDETCIVDGKEVTISGDNSMTVNRSIDGGRTWGKVIALDFDDDGRKFNDKNAMTADPFNSRYVYASWDKLIDFTVPSSCNEQTSSLLKKASLQKKATQKKRKAAIVAANYDGVELARERRRAKRAKAGFVPRNAAGAPDAPTVKYTGPSYFVRTTDGGRTWEPEKLIFDPGPNAQTINNLIEVLPNGTLLNLYTHILADGSIKLGFVRSRDRGATFKEPETAFDMNVTLNGTITPDAKEPVRDANVLYDVAVDPRSGNIYVVWQDGREGDLDRVAFAMSRNRGRTWSDAVIINKTPKSENPLREQAFIPSVEVSRNGEVIVTYYDFRNDTDDGRELTDLWSIKCNARWDNRCTSAKGWGEERRLTSSSFNMLDAPIARGHFLGDYQGLARAGGKVYAFFGKAVADNVNDMFFTRVDGSEEER